MSPDPSRNPIPAPSPTTNARPQDRLADALSLARRDSNIALSTGAATTDEIQTLRSNLRAAQSAQSSADARAADAEKQSTDLREIAGRMTEEISQMQRMITTLTQDKEGGNSVVDRLKGQISSMNEM